MKTVTLLDGKVWDYSELIKNMYDDDFYYGYMNKASLSSSSCKKLLESKEDYLASLMEEEPTKPNQAFVEGGLFHQMALEPEKASSHIVVDVGTKRNKIYTQTKESYSDKKEINVYTKKEWDRCKAWQVAVEAHPKFKDIVDGSVFEVPEVVFVEGIPFRVKGDIVNHGSYLADLKTTRSLEMFREAASNYNYDLQAELYRRAFNVKTFTFVVVDKKTSEVAIFDCSDDFFESGKEKLNKAISNYKKWFVS